MCLGWLFFCFEWKNKTTTTRWFFSGGEKTWKNGVAVSWSMLSGGFFGEDLGGEKPVRF